MKEIPNNMFKPVFFIILTLALVINLLLILPKAVDLVSTRVIATNIPNNSTGEQAKQILGTEKIFLPPLSYGLAAPEILARALVIEDLDSNLILLSKNPSSRIPIASTTKIMTALVACDIYRPNDVLTVPDLSEVPGSTMGLISGETLMVRSLLYGLLLNSGNDAAYALSYNYPGGTLAFVEAMNKKAQTLGLSNTHFDNPAGFDGDGHYSSAIDLAEIAKEANRNSQLQRIFSTKETIVYSSDKIISHYLKNLNKLLILPGVLGMKTGTTPLAKENLVTLVERDNHTILIVLLGSNDRFGETEKLIDWVFANYSW